MSVAWKRDKAYVREALWVKLNLPSAVSVEVTSRTAALEALLCFFACDRPQVLLRW